MLVATPSGITLAPEGGAHQSIGTPLIGMAQDGLASFEPAFVDELAAIMEWSFEYIQRAGEGEPSERTGCVTRRRLGLSAPVDAPAGADRADGFARARVGYRRWCLLAAPAGPCM